MKSYPRGVYIHIPFCKYICSYCDFNKFFIQRQPVDKYIDCLIKEIETIEQVSDIETIYIGGGTPSALNDEQLHRLLTALRKKIPGQLREFTFEANPRINKILRVGFKCKFTKLSWNFFSKCS